MKGGIMDGLSTLVGALIWLVVLVMFIVLVSRVGKIRDYLILINEKMNSLILLQGGEVIPDNMRKCPHCGALTSRINATCRECKKHMHKKYG
jgi:hypothetical protein